MKIKSISLLTRCEICHQSDMFDVERQNCGRCHDIKDDFVEDLIWDMQREDELVQFAKKKYQLNDNDKIKVSRHYEFWRHENRHLYEAQLNEYLAIRLGVDIIVVKKKSFYEKLRIIAYFNASDSIVPKKRDPMLYLGFLALVFGRIANIEMLLYFAIIFFGISILKYINRKTRSVTEFEKLNKYWWRDISGDHNLILEKYKSE